MEIAFDPKKSAKNERERGLPFALVAELEWDKARAFPDERNDYGEERLTTDVRAYGFFEARVTDGTSATIIQWMGETKLRFFPLVRDEEWGLRLHRVDLAISKVLAASSLRKARDFADLVAKAWARRVGTAHG